MRSRRCRLINAFIVVIVVTASAVSSNAFISTQSSYASSGRHGRLNGSLVEQRKTSSVLLKETKADLEVLAKQLNPVLGYFDPLNLVDRLPFFWFSRESKIGFLRHSEIKHGRVAMMAFVGYIVQSIYVFPWSLTLDGTPHPSVNLSPSEQWDLLPLAAKLQIIFFVGVLEFYSELTPTEFTTSFEKHYMRGGKPGRYPPFDDAPHPVPFNLYDPFGLSGLFTKDRKRFGLNVELNHGRLAMIGIMGFLVEQKIPGAIPLLTGFIRPYGGQVMAPFEANILLP